MPCRFATKEDRPHFLRLWSAYLYDQRERGSHLKASDQNLRVFREYFDSYMNGQLAGTVVLWEPDDLADPGGVVMGGSEFGVKVWDTDYARLATLWGIYVAPEHRGKRIGLEMEQFGEQSLVAHGFDAVRTSVLCSNEEGQGNWNNWNEHNGVRAYDTSIIASIGQEE